MTEFISFLARHTAMALVIDAQIAGISGDMLLCSLVNMGADPERIVSAVRRAASGIRGTEISDIGFERVTKHGIAATSLRLDVSGELASGSASELGSHIAAAAESEQLGEAARKFAASSMHTLVAAESAVHGVPQSSVHLHEAANLDTIVDILGTAIAMDDLDLFSERIVCTPVAVGGGELTFSHGTTSNPAAAVLEILRDTGIEMLGGPVGAELTTPTGACMLASLNPECRRFYPQMSVSGIGYGAGSADHEGFANVLKLVRGAGSDRLSSDTLSSDTVRILETNLDNITGEEMGHAVEALMRAGARDVTVLPGLTKKGRPASLVTAVCDAASYDAVLAALFVETGTLGVRVRDSYRVIAQRRSGTAGVTLGGRSYEIRYKAAGGQAPRPEHDDVARVASDLGVPLRQARRMIEDAIPGGAQ